MIAPPRVLFVTRRFWPLANDNVCRLISLADALQSAGWEVQVLTAQWHSAWPEQVALRDWRVQRVGPSPSTPFRAKRYARAVGDWLAKHACTFDCLVTDSHEEEALTLTGHPCKELPPVIVRHDICEGVGPLAERQRARALIACKQAAYVIVPHEHARRELVSAGLSADHVLHVHDGPFPKIARDDLSRSQARRALADINHELFLRAGDRLCVCPSDLVKGAGLEFLIRTLGPIIESRQDVRCWLVGDGPDRSRLYELLRREGWRQDVLMPGTFEDLDVVLAAADLCVVPGHSQGLSWLVPSALTNGLTTFLCDSTAARSRLSTNAAALMFEQGNAQQLTMMLEKWLAQPSYFKSALAKVSEHLQNIPPIVERWRDLVAHMNHISGPVR
jgi:glycosyltransferase involved in cell wall biosynthesis